MSKRICFIGIGAMGAPMAACLLRAGFDVCVYDLSPLRMHEFVVNFGGCSAESPAQGCLNAEVVIMILPNSAVVQEVLFGPHGIAPVLKPGTVVIDMTSGVPAITIELNRRLAQRDILFFDAPVSGAVPRAESGTLTIMVGGSAQEIDPVLPVLNAMGTVTRCGAIGSGDAMKALNNLVSCGGYLIGIEALLIGSRFGLDPQKMLQVLNHSSGMNNSTEKKFQQYVLSRKFNSGFPIHMMLKDLKNATDMAHQLEVHAPFSQLCFELWAGAAAMLGPEVDHTAVALMSEAMAGSKI